MSRIDVILVSLADLLASNASKSSIVRALHAFSCERDEDVEIFLHRYAINNEKNGASRTYLVLDRRALEDGGEIKVVAFFALAIAITDYTSIGSDTRRSIMGFVPGLSSSSFFPGYLLAQLARADRYSHDDLDCADLIETAEEYISEAAKYVGGRIIYLDCKEELVAYYERQGYEQLYFDETRGLHKMLKHLP